MGVSISKLKVLFFAEGATLAHVVRPLALARGLDAERFEVVFCRPSAFHWLTVDSDFSVRDLAVQSSSVFAKRLNAGHPLYTYKTLKRYVQDDLALIDSVQPDAIVGDFRLSLSVSARLRSLPYLAICDAYWSPERALEPVLPVLAFTPYVPLAMAEWMFQQLSGLALRGHAVPMERLRAKYDLPGFGFDLRCCYSDADIRLFANFPPLFPEVRPSATADFIGPITWFPDIAGAPGFTCDDEPLIYLTMGSSGDARLLASIVPVLEETGLPVFVSTAGRSFVAPSRRTRVFDYLPGNTLCRKARLVVCNGGSPTTSQALAAGVPVLGIAQNMDQFLNMRAIEAYGAGKLLRADRVNRMDLQRVVALLLQDRSFQDRARELAASSAPDTAATILASKILSLREKSS